MKLEPSAGAQQSLSQAQPSLFRQEKSSHEKSSLKTGTAKKDLVTTGIKSEASAGAQQQSIMQVKPSSRQQAQPSATTTQAAERSKAIAEAKNVVEKPKLKETKTRIMTLNNAEAEKREAARTEAKAFLTKIFSEFSPPPPMQIPSSTSTVPAAATVVVADKSSPFDNNDSGNNDLLSSAVVSSNKQGKSSATIQETKAVNYY